MKCKTSTINHQDLKQKYFLLKTLTRELCSQCANSGASGKCTFGCSYFRTQFSYKSPKTRECCTLGGRPEYWERRRQSGAAEGGKGETSLLDFSLIQCGPLSFFKARPLAIIRPYICSLSLLFVSAYTLQSSNPQPDSRALPLP